MAQRKLVKMSLPRFVAIVLLSALFSAESGLAAEGSCAWATRCCPGRDSSCVVNGLQPGGGGYISKPCYCDEGCLETNDCCPDYKQVCAVKGKISSKVIC